MKKVNKNPGAHRVESIHPTYIRLCNSDSFIFIFCRSHQLYILENKTLLNQISGYVSFLGKVVNRK